jgi:2-polyprenyl-6-methoxyphenol hydroxylase-like FAD-dependent oxidoreductase
VNDERGFDVVIVGAGPVGLFLAAELRLAGAAPVVVERLAEPDPGKSDDDRGLTARTVQTLDLRGLAEPTVAMTEAALRRLAGFVEQPAAGEGRPPQDLAELMRSLGMADFKGDFAMLPLIDHDGHLADLAPPLMVMQGEFERLLAERVAGLGVPVWRGREVVDIVAENHQVTVVFADGEQVCAAWLVGCDGGRSTVRRRAGIDFSGTGPAMVARVAVTRLTAPDKLSPGFHRVPAGIFAVSAPPAPSVTIEFDPESFDRDTTLTVAEFEASLRRVSGVEVTVTGITEPMRITDNARQATTYRQGRVLLAGDAAHVHSPIGGQGLNLGLQDAANLGWKLGLVVRGLAAEDLLDTYTAERHPIGAQVLRDSRAETALLRTDPHTEALREVMGELMREPQAARVLLETSNGLRIRYPASENAHPLVGRFVPDLTFTGAGRPADLLRDGQALLLDLTESASLQHAADGWTDRVSTVTATCPDLTALLIRPDGYVAWAANGAPDLDELRSALTQWFGPPAS